MTHSSPELLFYMPYTNSIPHVELHIQLTLEQYLELHRSTYTQIVFNKYTIDRLYLGCRP